MRCSPPLEEALELGDGGLVLAGESPRQLVAERQAQSRNKRGDHLPVHLDHIIDDAQFGHAGRPRGFCGTLIAVPSCSSAKQWKIVLSAVGAQ